MSAPQGEPLYAVWKAALERSEPPFDQAGVRQRVLAAHGASRRPRALSGSHRLALAGAALAVAAAVLLLLRWPGPTSFQVAGHSGQVGAWLSAQPSQELSLSFSEGTQVSLGSGSRGRVSQVSRAGARIELERGSVRAEVSHRPGAEWSFGAGPFEVSVLGTSLNVSWSPEAGQFELAVSRGAVLVKGPFIQGPQEVRAGQVCRVDLTRRLMELGQVTASAASSARHQTAEPTPSVASNAAPAPEAASPDSSEPATASWLQLARGGKHRDAVGSAERAGLPGIYRSVSAESLLELAAAARQAGRPDVERAALLACRKRAPSQPAAAQAAYLLGRASGPAEAASWFETYLRDQPHGLLAREASGRLIESYAAAGNRGAAAQAASRYLAAYPHGPHASMARQTLGAHGESRD